MLDHRHATITSISSLLYLILLAMAGRLSPSPVAILSSRRRPSRPYPVLPIPEQEQSNHGRAAGVAVHVEEAESWLPGSAGRDA
jgi:hypothetical protein